MLDLFVKVSYETEIDVWQYNQTNQRSKEPTKSYRTLYVYKH